MKGAIILHFSMSQFLAPRNFIPVCGTSHCRPLVLKFFTQNFKRNALVRIFLRNLETLKKTFPSDALSKFPCFYKPENTSDFVCRSYYSVMASGLKQLLTLFCYDPFGSEEFSALHLCSYSYTGCWALGNAKKK